MPTILASNVYNAARRICPAVLQIFKDETTIRISLGLFRPDMQDDLQMWIRKEPEGDHVHAIETKARSIPLQLWVKIRELSTDFIEKGENLRFPGVLQALKKTLEAWFHEEPFAFQH